MFGRGFGQGGRRGGGLGRGRGAYGPGYGRAEWRTGAMPWGGPPPWARYWAVDLPDTAERKAWLEQAKAHLQRRLEEIEQELKALSDVE